MTLLSKRVFCNRFQFLVREDLVILCVKIMKLSAIRKVTHGRNYIIEFYGLNFVDQNIYPKIYLVKIIAKVCSLSYL